MSESTLFPLGSPDLMQCCCVVSGTSTRCREWGKPEMGSDIFTCEAHLAELEFWLNHYADRDRKENRN